MLVYEKVKKQPITVEKTQLAVLKGMFTVEDSEEDVVRIK